VIEDVPSPLVVAFVLLFGALVGSFLNVVIARVPSGESIVRPRSRCPACRTPIAWFDNVPVVSWLVLRGRCRSCRAAIPVRYPLVELLGAGAAYLAWWRHGLSPAAAAELAFALLLVALSFIDLDTWLLPHALTIPLLVLGLGANAVGIGAAPSLASSALGAVIGFASFALVSLAGARLLRREALGFGDVILLAALGAWLGALALVPIVLLSSIQGSVIGLVLIALGKGEPGREAPREAEPASFPSANPSTTTPTPSTTAPTPITAPTDDRPPGTSAAVSLADEDWVPPRNAIPFGPFLALAALEWLYLGDVLARAIPALGLFR